MFYANEQEVTKELGESRRGTCDQCERERPVWAFMALWMCGPCLTGQESPAPKGAEAGAVQVLKGPET